MNTGGFSEQNFHDGDTTIAGNLTISGEIFVGTGGGESGYLDSGDYKTVITAGGVAWNSLTLTPGTSARYAKNGNIIQFYATLRGNIKANQPSAVFTLKVPGPDLFGVAPLPFATIASTFLLTDGSIYNGVVTNISTVGNTTSIILLYVRSSGSNITTSQDFDITLTYKLAGEDKPASALVVGGGGGGGGGVSNPMTSDLKGGGFNISNVGDISASTFNGGNILTNPITENLNVAGYGLYNVALLSVDNIESNGGVPVNFNNSIDFNNQGSLIGCVDIRTGSIGNNPAVGNNDLTINSDVVLSGTTLRGATEIITTDLKTTSINTNTAGDPIIVNTDMNITNFRLLGASVVQGVIIETEVVFASQSVNLEGTGHVVQATFVEAGDLRGFTLTGRDGSLALTTDMTGGAHNLSGFGDISASTFNGGTLLSNPLSSDLNGGGFNIINSGILFANEINSNSSGAPIISGASLDMSGNNILGVSALSSTDIVNDTIYSKRISKNSLLAVDEIQVEKIKMLENINLDNNSIENVNVLTTNAITSDQVSIDVNKSIDFKSTSSIIGCIDIRTNSIGLNDAKEITINGDVSMSGNTIFGCQDVITTKIEAEILDITSKLQLFGTGVIENALSTQTTELKVSDIKSNTDGVLTAPVNFLNNIDMKNNSILNLGNLNTTSINISSSIDVPIINTIKYIRNLSDIDSFTFNGIYVVCAIITIPSSTPFTTSGDTMFIGYDREKTGFIFNNPSFQGFCFTSTSHNISFMNMRISNISPTRSLFNFTDQTKQKKVTISNSLFIDCKNESVVVITGYDLIDINQTVFEFCNPTLNHLTISSCDKLQVANCTLYKSFDAQANFGTAPLLWLQGSILGASIIGCIFQPADAQDGIRSDSVVNPEGLLISNNIFKGNTAGQQLNYTPHPQTLVTTNYGIVDTNYHRSGNQLVIFHTTANNGTTATVSIRYERTGNSITMSIPQINLNIGNSSYPSIKSQGNVPFPLWALPSNFGGARPRFSFPAIIRTAQTTRAIGRITFTPQVSGDYGIIEIFRDPSGTQWSTANDVGTDGITTLTYRCLDTIS
jgi:hypothetical protein